MGKKASDSWLPVDLYIQQQDFSLCFMICDMCLRCVFQSRCDTCGLVGCRQPFIAAITTLPTRNISEIVAIRICTRHGTAPLPSVQQYQSDCSSSKFEHIANKAKYHGNSCSTCLHFVCVHASVDLRSGEHVLYLRLPKLRSDSDSCTARARRSKASTPTAT